MAVFEKIMAKYKIYMEVGIHLEVEADKEETASALAAGALQVSVLDGYDTEITDKYVIAEKIEVDDDLS